MTRRLLRIAGLGIFLLSAGALMAQRGRQSSSTMPTAGASDLIVHGSVVLPGATALGRLVAVERTCVGRSREAVFGDARGRFSFNLGAIERGGPTNLNSGTFSNAGDMRTCVVRASLAGYHPQTVALDGIVKSEKGNLGEMVLQPLGKQAFAAVSATDAEIPKNARKDYDAGLDAAAKSKWPEAIAAMKKAAATYGKFATAWLSLGMLEASMNDSVAALHSYAQAIAADEKFAPAYVELAALQTAAGDWNKAIESAGKAISLDPDAFPRAYYLVAISNVRLNQAGAAEKSAEEGIRADVDHEIPDLEYIEGVLLLSKGDVPGGRKQLENYLSHAPSGVNVTNARRQLAETPESNLSNR